MSDRMDDGTVFANSLSLADLAGVLKRSSRLILAMVFLCELLGVAYLFVVPPQYTTQVIFAPQTDNGRSGGIGSLTGALGTIGSLGGTASLLGVGNSRLNNDFSKFALLLTSSRVAAAAENKYHFMKLFFPGWDQAAGKWERPSLSVTGWLRAGVHMLFGRPVWRAPDAADLAAVFDDKLIKSIDDTTGFLTVSMESDNPELDRRVLIALSEVTNQILRQDAQQRAKTQIDYLAGQLRIVTNTDQHFALANLLSSQEEDLMLSSSGIPFATQTLSPPVTFYSQPKPAIGLTLAIALAVGVFLGIFVTLVREAIGHARGQMPSPVEDIMRNWLTRYSKAIPHRH